jgi:hypothetical protein
MCAVVVQIDALHEQRPPGPPHRRQGRARERSMSERPRSALAANDARLDAVACRKSEQLCARQRRRELRRQRLPHE